MSTRIDLAAPDCIRTRNPAYKVDRIVIHTMEGTLAGTVAWFKRAGRSVPTAAHYCIGQNGDIVQMVPDDRKAIHAGSKTQAGWNDRSIGIEHEGYADSTQWPAALLESSAKVTAIMCRKFGIPVDRAHIVGHAEIPGVDHRDPGGWWPWDDYMERVRAALAELA